MVKLILLIEDEDEIRNYVKGLLLDSGYQTLDVSDGIKALSLIEERHPDLVIVDLGLPKLSGESIVSEVRRKYPELPVIILTAKSGVENVVQGFKLGADDYVTKPFKKDELLARVKARLRHLESNGSYLQVGDLELHSKTFEVKRGDKMINLSHKEYELLQYLMLNAGRVLTRDMILQRIWMRVDYIEPRVVDVYVGYLRRKIDSGYKKQLINTIRGFGYMIKE